MDRARAMSPPASSTGGSSYGDVDVLSPAGLDELRTRLGARPNPSPGARLKRSAAAPALGRHPLTSPAPPSLVSLPPEHEDWRARVDGMRALTAALELPPAPDPPSSAATAGDDAALDDSLEATPDAPPPEDPPPPPPLDRATLVQFRHKCAHLLADQLAHLRGEVVAAACASVSALADRAAADPSLVPLVSPLCADVFAPALLRLMSREGDRAGADRGHMAMTRCLAASREPDLARRLAGALAGPRRSPSARLRARVVDHLSRALADWPPEILLTCRADIERAMMTCFSDESVDVRRGARACFDVYAATWPRRAERIVGAAEPRARQLILAGVLEAPEENGRWAKGGVLPSRRRESAPVRAALEEERAARLAERGGGGKENRPRRDAAGDRGGDFTLDDERDAADVSEDVASRMLTSAAAEASRAPIAASAPVAWARDAAAEAPAPAPPLPLFEEPPDLIRARTLAEIGEERAEAEKKPLAAYYAARRARGDATLSEIHPHTAMDDFHEEAALARDVDALNARLRDAHAASVRRRATQTYIDAMTRPMTTREDANGNPSSVRGREGPVAASAKAASAKAANRLRDDGGDDDWRWTDGYAGEEADETRWRAPDEGWVRDPETNRYVPMREYLARWAPPKARILGVGGLGGSPPRAGGAGGAGGAGSRRSAEDREKALRRIRREWNDAQYEVRDERGDPVETTRKTTAAGSRSPAIDAAPVGVSSASASSSRPGGMTLRELFDFYDQDKGGTVNKGELICICNDLGALEGVRADDAAAALDDAYRRADADADGGIDFDELGAFMAAFARAERRALAPRPIPSNFRAGDEAARGVFSRHCSKKHPMEMNSASFLRCARKSGFVDARLDATAVAIVFAVSRKPKTKRLTYADFLRAMATIAALRAASFEATVNAFVAKNGGETAKAADAAKSAADAANSAAEAARREAGWGYGVRDKRDAAANLAAGGEVDRAEAGDAEESLLDAGSARVPTELETREARAARVRSQSEAARRLRERRARVAAKEAADEKLYREMTARQDARLAEAKMRKEDDDRALELFRLRAENDLLKARLDRIFYDRLIAPGELVRDERMSPAKAGRLLEKNDASPRRGEPEPNPGSHRPRARVFRGLGVRDGEGNGGGTVYDVEPSATPNRYPGSFEREIEARRADIADRTARKREMGSRLAARDEGAPAS